MNKLRLFSFIAFVGILTMSVGRVHAGYFTTTSTGVFLFDTRNDGTIEISTGSPSWEITDVYVQVATSGYVNGESFLILVDSVPNNVNANSTSTCAGGCGYVYPGDFASGQLMIPPISIVQSTATNTPIPLVHVDLKDGYGRGIKPRFGLSLFIAGPTVSTYTTTIRTQPAVGRVPY